MRIRRDPKSPWGASVWFEEHEFDEIMDGVRNRAGEGVFRPGEGVDVELILTRSFGVVPDYLDLEPGVLGRTCFEADGTFQIQISRQLSDQAERDPVARRRLRSTMAHEGGHGGLHARLHLGDQQTISLFEDVPRLGARIMCRGETIEATNPVHPRGYDGRWWEYQANRAMASLLLPRALLLDQVSVLLRTFEHGTVPDVIESGNGSAFLHRLAETFDVNPRMVFYRLIELELIPRNLSQMALQFEP